MLARSRTLLCCRAFDLAALTASTVISVVADLSLPFVTSLALPPNRLAAAWQHLVGCQIAIPG